MASKLKIVVKKNGPTGNVFAVVADAIKVLEEDGHPGYSRMLQAKVFSLIQAGTGSYEDVLQIVSGYVELERG